ncbi:mannose-1-phosphate guanylyltransferase/mannose-6-phosphate isomerase [Sphingomonadales bacterium EhC05]|jgi:mannose-1-phosphate guanylyltransferase/mannose-1-phosphate guanylyltransferase/mannose-6-phosphate isomerase|uniref:mannose-1-phosphate guanylyltransferase/mannose-6-phosphate isomerase n=1 Tax=Parasphingorhabdus sp. TaxID=2709688 RepID=UPI0007F35CE1|nr:mannose-1-phosphate guanylyltransferase/mannose-6-phosphate isomerase [Sphingomonadales bacterium EhC05]
MTTENSLITPVILSGGSGTRLWPLSTNAKPKQFLNLTGTESMFELTLSRCGDTAIFTPPIIVGNNRHADLAEAQMDAFGVTPVAHILEPCARNTAPAIALAALAAENPAQPILIMPSDHIIQDIPAFTAAVRNALPVAQSGWLVTFGIEPTGPETGYGYIQQGAAIDGNSNGFAAAKFVEKPDLENAEKMLSTGEFYWNAGIFLFRADAYLAALEAHAPDMLQSVRDAMDKAVQTGARIAPDEAAFSGATSDSIDYAVMEKAEKVAVVPISPGWSDVGSWDSLFDLSDKDENSNATSGEAVALESHGNLIHAEGISVATYGVQDLIIVANGKQIMILPRGQSQNVKKIIGQMKQAD